MPLNMNIIQDTSINDATANPSDVLYGKTFYNNNGKQQGSLELKEFDIRIAKSDMFPISSKVSGYDIIGGVNFVYNNKLYSLCDTDFDNKTTRLFIYNINQKTWGYEDIRGLKFKGRYAYATSSGNMYTSYYDSEHVTDPKAICIYNLKNKSSSTISAMWLKSYNVINDIVYYSSGYFTYTSSYIEKINEKNKSTTIVLKLPYAYCDAIVGYEDTLFLCGCYDHSSDSSNTICMYRNKSLTTLANIPDSVPINQLQTFVYGDKIIFLSPNFTTNSEDGISYIYNIAENSWTEIYITDDNRPYLNQVFSYNNKWYCMVDTIGGEHYTIEIFKTYKL